MPCASLVKTKKGGPGMDTDSFTSPSKEYEVFQKYFGKLIRGIPDPVRLAADLYSANLISESTKC